MKTGYKETLLRYLPQILTGIFTTLLLFSTLLIGRNWITNGDVIREQLNREMRFALQSKASEVEGILQRTYHTIRTISLLPGCAGNCPRTIAAAIKKT